VGLLYKAHIFVANSYIALIYPCLFFTGLRRRSRVILMLTATIIFVAVIGVAQTLPRVPVLKLNGSGLQVYLVTLIERSDPGLLQTFFHGVFLDNPLPRLAQGMMAVLMVLLFSFGLWNVGLAGALLARWSKLPALIRWLPVMVVGNYLIMALGLALDERQVGTPDELLNRPVVWAYFIVATFATALLYRWCIGNQLPRRGWPLACSAVLVAGVAATTLVNTHAMQTFPAGPYPSNFRLQSSIDVCSLQAANFLRLNSQAKDIVQTSDGDPGFKFTALSERQLFAGKVSFGGKNELQQQRLRDMDALLALLNENAIVQYAAKQGIDWFLLTPEAEAAWPDSLLNQAAFACGGYRLYRFGSRASNAM
jgi:hypothetical protein